MHTDKPALVTATLTRTFDELADRSARLARVLRDHGVGPGERVALMLANSCEWFETNVAEFPKTEPASSPR